MVSLMSTLVSCHQGQTTHTWVASCITVIHHWALCLWIWVRKSALGVAQKTVCFGNVTGHCSVLMAGRGDNGDSKWQTPQSPLPSDLGRHRRKSAFTHSGWGSAVFWPHAQPMLTWYFMILSMRTAKVSLLYFGMCQVHSTWGWR